MSIRPVRWGPAPPAPGPGGYELGPTPYVSRRCVLVATDERAQLPHLRVLLPHATYHPPAPPLIGSNCRVIGANPTGRNPNNFVVAFHAGALYIPAGALAVLLASRPRHDGGLDLTPGRGRLPNWTDHPEEGATDVERH